MTVSAIAMDLELNVLIVGGIGLHLMLVRVMSEMSHGVFPFMLAIHGGRRPRRLQRQYNQQENEQQAFHGCGLYGHCAVVLTGAGKSLGFHVCLIWPGGRA